jgi:ABC-type nitrate/sulfonate/bicarbonate transport system ATPase subunit
MTAELATIVSGDSSPPLSAPASCDHAAELRRGEPPGVVVDGLVKEYALEGVTVRALDGVSIDVKPGEFVTLVGPSGSGKSTLLRIVAGLEEPTCGRVEVGCVAMPRRLGASGYMPQHDMLLPWRTVLDNAILPLEYHGVPRKEARRAAAALLAAFGLGGFEGARPSALSGGMRQRVALARTVLTGRRALLLDEPFGALDALTRLEMQRWLLDVWARLGATVVLVTHDLEEAVHLSDRVYVLSARPGRVADEVVIPLPRPRPQDVVATPAFAALKGRLLAAVRVAARGAMGL